VTWDERISATLTTTPNLELALAERRRTHERRRRARWLALGAVAGAVAVVLGVVQLRDRAAHEALSVPVRHEARAGDPQVPAVVWPRGLPDHGAWADDPWVEALREYHLVWPTAWNSGRVSGRADLLQAAVPEVVDQDQRFLDVYSWASRSSDQIPVSFGPIPFEVLEVDVNDDGTGAAVLVCTFDARSADESDDPEAVQSRVDGEKTVWVMVRGQDGRIRVWGSYTEGRTADQRACTISDQHYGLFDPVPTRLIAPLPDDWSPEAEPEPGPRLEDVEDEVGRQVYLDSLMQRYDALRELTEREARR
jgi:hypothetical protein